MDDRPRQPQTHFFTLRLWLAEADHGQAEWRGKLHHVPSGQTRYFRDWSTLVVYLRDLLADLEPLHPDTDAGG